MATCACGREALPEDGRFADAPVESGVSVVGGATLPIGLLELLQSRVGCTYLSDLRISSNLPFIGRALRKIDPEVFGVREWSDAVAYITGESPHFGRPSDAARYLANYTGSPHLEAEKAEPR